MRTSEKGLGLIKRFEGLRLEAYRCPADVWTIGYGTTGGVVQGMTITKTMAEDLLRQDVERFERDVARAVTVPLSQCQFDALVSFTYNLGATNLRSSTLLRLLNAGDYVGAVAQFPRWNKAKGKVLQGLIARREAEQAMFQGVA